VLAAPELVVTQTIEVLGELEIATELQRRMLADGVMGCEEGAEAQSGHEGSLSSGGRDRRAARLYGVRRVPGAYNSAAGMTVPDLRAHLLGALTFVVAVAALAPVLFFAAIQHTGRLAIGKLMVVE
jgi:hypothetical protein